ncbi:MAG: hypothetical protein ACTSRX_03670 [Promethearchaeota archaeon]
MNIIYKNYAPNEGLEEIQGKLYSMNNNRTVTGKEIKDRFEQEKIDPKSVIYAFSSDNKPLAYIQARDYPQLGQIQLGRPWAIPECPDEVKEKLINDLFKYMVSRETDLKLLLNTNLDPKMEKLAKDHDMVMDRNLVQLEFDTTTLAKFDKSPYNYTIHKATIDDLEAIYTCRNLAYRTDPNERNDRFTEYLKTTIESGYFYLVYEGETLIGAGASRKPTEEEETTNLGLAIVFTLLEKEEAIVFLFDHLLNLAEKDGWKKNHISIGYTDENDREMGILRSVARKEEKISTRYLTK